MNFSLHEKATRSNIQHPLTGGRKQQTMLQRPHINPVTGEKLPITSSRVQSQKEVKSENAYGVPFLNLNYLKDDDKKTCPAIYDVMDYSLDTPNSGSTVSWGTQKSGRGYPVKSIKTEMLGRAQSNRNVTRPDGVPELRIDAGGPESHRRPDKKTAWDRDPVPATLSQPSARFRQMYQQYSDEMKQSYRDHVNTSRPGLGNKEVRRSVDSKAEIRQEHKDEIEEKAQQQTDGLLHTMQHYTEMKQQKKKDAEELLEKNKKLKLVETVMIDQLSRTVISDPEQNDLHTDRHNSSHKSRATNRHLHDSKVSTRATATENLLSRRVRFGARILTQNGHDALRELTGFFFHFDKSLTIYEFRQFGKSAKALPFIYRGQYQHVSGPHQGLPYSLSDIYVGANLKIPTAGQLALTDSLAGNSYITLRITDVDENEKRAVLALTDSEDERLPVPREQDIDSREYLRRIQDCVQKQICKRAVRTITGLGRYYHALDQYNTGILDQYDLEKGLQTFHINLDMEQLEQVFEILDAEGCKALDYKEYMRGVLGEMSETRKMLVRKAFLKLDSSKQGLVQLSEVQKYFNTHRDYKATPDGDSRVSAIQAFLDAVRDSNKQEHISYLQFEEYYEGLSVSLPSDETFINNVCNTWNI
ncbi:hypothetical protein BsWGS_12228 [Bradybaena similaris]